MTDKKRDNTKLRIHINQCCFNDRNSVINQVTFEITKVYAISVRDNDTDYEVCYHYFILSFSLSPILIFLPVPY